MARIYLDNNATTPVDDRVLEAMLPYFSDEFGNASSIHGFGQRARSAVEEARARVARLIGARPREVFFTSGGTESDNTALFGVARSREGGRLLTSTIEHPAVLGAARRLAGQGFEVEFLAVDRGGRVRLDRLEEALEQKTLLVSIMHGNNEIGVIQDLERICRLAHARGTLVHTDAVQTVGKIAVDVQALGVDLLSLSAHKFHGPKGVGALYVRTGVEMESYLVGGSHERNRRAGTLNVPGIVGLGRAAELAGEALQEMATRVRSLRDRLEEGLQARIPGARVNGSTEHRLPHVSNLTFPGMEGEALLVALDLEGIAVSTGAACSSGSLKPSHVLEALGGGSRRAASAIRFSLSRMNNAAEIDRLLERMPAIVERMQQVGSPG